KAGECPSRVLMARPHPGLRPPLSTKSAWRGAWQDPLIASGPSQAALAHGASQASVGLGSCQPRRGEIAEPRSKAWALLFRPFGAGLSRSPRLPVKPRKPLLLERGAKGGVRPRHQPPTGDSPLSRLRV